MTFNVSSINVKLDPKDLGHAMTIITLSLEMHVNVSLQAIGARGMLQSRLRWIMTMMVVPGERWERLESGWYACLANADDLLQNSSSLVTWWPTILQGLQQDDHHL